MEVLFKLKKLKENKLLIAINFFLGITTCIYAPFDMYVNNRTDFWFYLRDFWWIPLVCGNFAILCGILVGCILKGFVRRLYEGLILAMGVATYLQSNFMSLRVGIMAGEQIKWEEYQKQFVLNLTIWIFITLVIAVLSVRRKARFEKIAMIGTVFLSVVQMVSLIIILFPYAFEGGENKNYSTEKNFGSVSRQENIIVFVVDMFDKEYCEEILKDSPKVLEELDGFTYFRNATGYYGTTWYTIPSFLTGECYCNQSSVSDWMNQVADNEKLWWDYLLEEGYELGVYTDTPYIPERLQDNLNNIVNTRLRINHYKDFTIDLYRFVMCRIFPDIIKPMVWMDGTEFSRWIEIDSEYQTWDCADNFYFKERVINGIKANKDEKQFKLIHIQGSHGPFRMDAEGNRLPGYETSPVESTKGAFIYLKQYLNDMKKEGVYDKASIMILADHGDVFGGITNPTIMIKPKGMSGKLKISDAPVSQREFAATMLDLADIEGEELGKSMLKIKVGEKRERIYYRYGVEKGYNLIEYVIDDEGNDTKENYHLTGYQYLPNGDRVAFEYNQNEPQDKYFGIQAWVMRKNRKFRCLR